MTTGRDWPPWHDDTLRRLNTIDAAIGKLARDLLWRWLLVVVGLIICAVFLTVFQVDATHTADKASELTRTIQVQRFHSLYDQCAETNSRHDQTVQRLSFELQRQEQTHPEQKARLEQSRVTTTFLIDALAPRTADCVAHARALTGANQ